MAKQKLLIIVGPTSSGKSALAVALARRFNGEVISADSQQVYKGLNIGTGKITKREMKGVQHHLLDILSPRQMFTAHDFVQKAQQAIFVIYHNKRLPIIAGGTGFYIDALLGRVQLPNVPANSKLRTHLEKKTTKQLFALLKRKDPGRAKTIEPHNKQRLIRGLEIIHALGTVPKYGHAVSIFDVLWIGLRTPMKELERNITIRLFARIGRGMVAEGKRLHKAGLSYKRMEQLGLEYRALARYLQGKINREEMIEGLTRDIRRYAKRQLTYWKRNKKIRWFDPIQKGKIYRTVRSWL